MSIYTASKTKHAQKWLDARANGFPIISTWIDEAGPGETADMGELWTRCIAEARTAKAVVLYREEGETLKGALIEVGAALGAGIPVFVVGEYTFAEYSWLYHPLVSWMVDLNDALTAATNVPVAS